MLPIMGSQTVHGMTPPSLFGKTRQALLALLYSRADEEHLQESLIQLAGLGRGTVQRELEFLARARDNHAFNDRPGCGAGSPG